MIVGAPYNLLSWNYFLKGQGHQAYWDQKWTSEQCSILIDEEYFEIKKHGVASGKWSLNKGDMLHSSATKRSAWKRTIDIDSPMGSLLLASNGAFRRSFFLALDGRVIATISPRRAFSWKAELDILVEEYDFPTMAFAFWLVITLWRRGEGSRS